MQEKQWTLDQSIAKIQVVGRWSMMELDQYM